MRILKHFVNLIESQLEELEHAAPTQTLYVALTAIKKSSRALTDFLNETE